MSRFSIALSGNDDVETVASLLQAQLLEHEIVMPLEALRDVAGAVVSDPRHGFILLAHAKDEAVGVAYAAAHLSAEHGGILGWLEELYVMPEQRGQGVGSALLDEVMVRALQLGWKALELEIVQGHERAVPLYQRHHFQRISRARFRRVLG